MSSIQSKKRKSDSIDVDAKVIPSVNIMPKISEEGDGVIGRADPKKADKRRRFRAIQPAHQQKLAEYPAKKMRNLQRLSQISALNKDMTSILPSKLKEWENSDDFKNDDSPPRFLSKALMDYNLRIDAIEERFCRIPGDVFTFGEGDSGQLGLADSIMESPTPREVTTLRDYKVILVSASALHTVALCEDGVVYTWGASDDGVLGRGFIPGSYKLEQNDEAAFVPKRTSDFIPSSAFLGPSSVLSAFSDNSTTLGGGDSSNNANHSAIITNVPDCARLRSTPASHGIDDASSITSHTSSVVSLKQSQEQQNPHPISDQISWVASGDCHTLCLSTTGRVYMFGCYRDTEGKTFRDATPPDEIREKIYYKAKLKKDQEAEKQGFDVKFYKSAPLGPQIYPVHCYKLPAKVKMLACSACANAAILDHSTRDDMSGTDLWKPNDKPQLVTWGIGQCGELGRKVHPMRKTGDDKNYDYEVIKEQYLTPKPVTWSGPTNVYRKVETVACGGYHMLVIVREYPLETTSSTKSKLPPWEKQPSHELRLYSSGLNNYGQLGLGDEKNRMELTRVEAIKDVWKVTAGVHHSLCLATNLRDLYAFGRSDSGQLGTTADLPAAGSFENVPRLIFLERERVSATGATKGLENPEIAQIDSGGNHNLLLTEEGEVYTWGYGDLGALGHGENKDEYRPRKLDVTGSRRKRWEEAKKKVAAGTATAKDRALAEKSKYGKARVSQVSGGGQHSAVIVSYDGDVLRKRTEELKLMELPETQLT